jgi:hypothetical protein
MDRHPGGPGFRLVLKLLESIGIPVLMSVWAERCCVRVTARNIFQIEQDPTIVPPVFAEGASGAVLRPVWNQCYPAGRGGFIHAGGSPGAAWPGAGDRSAAGGGGCG